MRVTSKRGKAAEKALIFIEVEQDSDTSGNSLQSMAFLLVAGAWLVRLYRTIVHALVTRTHVIFGLPLLHDRALSGQQQGKHFSAVVDLAFFSGYLLPPSEMRPDSKHLIVKRYI